MNQPKELLALRKRLAKRGYFNIHISKSSEQPNYYVIEAQEPLTHYNVPLVKTQMKKIIVTAKTLYSHPKNVSKIYAALHTDLAW